MMLSLAWRNLARHRRRTMMTALAVASAVTLLGWLVGFTYGAYDQMVDKVAHARIGHLQIARRGTLEQPAPAKTIPRAEQLVARVEALDGVRATSPRALAEGLLQRDSELVPAELIGVEAAAERRTSVVPHRLIGGPLAVRWCQEQMADALALLGGDEALFARWCQATRRGAFLPDDQPRAVVLGRGVARRLLVSVGDELTAQVVRARSAGRRPGERAGDPAGRRLVVTGLIASGSPEVDERAAYLDGALLQEMLGTDGPNEIVITLDDVSDLPEVRRQVTALLGEGEDLTVHSWAERDPALANMIDMAKGSRAIFFAILGFLILLSVANVTMMSVLERRREMAVMLALGLRRSRLVLMILTEVALLDVIAVSVGALGAAGLELFGRVHGWPLAWTGTETQTVEALSLAGVDHDTTFYANMPPLGAILIVVGVALTYLAMGLWAAFKVQRLEIVDTMRRG